MEGGTEGDYPVPAPGRTSVHTNPPAKAPTRAPRYEIK